MVRKVNQRTLDLLWASEGEGDKLPDGRYIAYLDRNATPENPYYDRSAGGLWTIGPGVTGSFVNRGTIMTRSQVEGYMNAELTRAGAYIEANVNRRLTDNEYGALCDFAYNLGVGRLTNILARINQGDNAGAMQILLQYNKGTKNGQKVVLRGLVTRRYKEKELFEWEDKKQLKDLSVPMQRADQAQKGMAAAGGVGAFLWTNWQQFSQMMSDHVGITILVSLGIGYGLCEVFKWYIHKEFDKGTYVPEGTKPIDEIEMPEDAQ